MADRAERRSRRVPRTDRWWWRDSARRFVAGHARKLVGAVPRLVLLLVIVWALTGPVDRAPMVAGAAGLPLAGAESMVQASPVFQETGFAVADGPIGNYFEARGGVRTFGPPVSNAFPLLGSTVQIFRNHVLKLEADGSVSTVNLFALGAIPFRNVGGRVVPEVDQGLVANAPVPGTPEYGARVQQFIQANAPDQWDGLPVGFHQAFLGTVQYEDAFPNGGERGLLPGFSHEVWGVPVSRPVRDAQNPDIVLLRWERGIMAWGRQSGVVSTVPLGETFKAVLTGDGLGPERAVAAAGSPFLLQFSPSDPNGLARPGDLPGSVLTVAFTPGRAAVNAAQLSDPYTGPATATPTPDPQVNLGAGFDPFMYVNGNYDAFNCNDFQSQAQAQAVLRADPSDPNSLDMTGPAGSGGPDGIACNSPTEAPEWAQFGMVPLPPVDLVPVGAGSAAQPVPAQPVPAAQAGVVSGAVVPGQGAAAPDACYGDERITFVPAEPRANNELLIVVTSSRPHPYGRLAGTERTTFMLERPGQLGYVWEWTVPLSWPGKHEYTFYVDSTIPCKSIEINVRQPLATRTPIPTKTPTPWAWDNGNGNDNSAFSTTSSAWNWDPYAYITPGVDAYNCDAFASQAQTQSVLRADPTDPNDLDPDFDGIACEDYKNFAYSEKDKSPVTRIAPPNTPAPGHSAPGAFDPAAYIIPGTDAFNCVDFASQADAQAVLRYGMQNGYGDPNKLDTANGTRAGGPDGIACDAAAEAPEWAAMFIMPLPPIDLTPVPTPTP